MRIHYPVALILLASMAPASECKIKWPNPNISVPAEVGHYIVSECHRYRGFAEESVADCIRGERYGYRAVVMLLTDPVDGEKFAERYRGCQVGLGDLGGRFHRRRAECMSTVAEYVWRFEFTREASGGRPIMVVTAD